MIQVLSVVWDVDPVIFNLGPIFNLDPISVRWYSLMFIFAFMFGLVIFKDMIKREGKDLILYDRILLPVFLGTILGARIGHCLFYQFDDYLARPLDVLLPFRDGHFVGYQGLASHGAAIGIIFGLYLYSKKNNVAFLWSLDRISITVALSGVFIRLGNLMNSEIYGHATDLPWGFVFKRTGETLAKHPTQLYEAFAYLIVFVILYALYLLKKPPLRDGVLFSLFCILLFSARFLIESIKEVQVGFEENMNFNMGQWLSLPLILLGCALLAYLYKKGIYQSTKISSN